MNHGRTAKKVALELYVAGNTPLSNEALERTRNLISRHPDIRFELDVIDVFENPKQTSQRKVLATPTLIKSAPMPTCRLIGDLGEPDHVARVMGLGPPGSLEPHREPLPSDSEGGG